MILSPKISIITTIYNVRKQDFLQCFDSIRQQTLTDWEWLIYDDASTESLSFLQECQAKEPRLILLKRGLKRQGAAWGRNQCLQAAKGQWIAVQDGDDVSDPRRLETLLAFLQEHPEYAWVSSAMQLFDAQGGYAVWHKKAVPQKKDCLWDIPFLHAATLFRRKVLVRVSGYRVEEMTTRGQDYDLFMRLMAEGFCGYNLPDILYEYRRSREAFYQRSWRLCWREAQVRFVGFKRLKLLLPWGIFWVFKPFVAWGLPRFWLQIIRPPHKINQ